MVKRYESQTKKRPEKKCPYCAIPKSYTNFKAHLRRCQNNKNKKITTTHIENITLTKENEDLKRKILELEYEIRNLKASLKKDNSRDEITIKDIVRNKSYGTERTYSFIWNRYINWCNINVMSPSSIESASLYIYEFKNPKCTKKIPKPSSVNQAISVLITCFKRLYTKDISSYLPRRTKFDFLKIKPKYVMDKDEIKSLLSTQLNNMENFLGCYVMIFSGSRVHTLSMLRHDNYYKGNLELTDHKTQQLLQFKFSNTMANVMDAYLKANTDKPFMFFSQDLKENKELVNMRGRHVGMKLRLILNKSKIFNVDPKKISLGSHIFRTTKVHLRANEMNNILVEECKKEINHSSFSNSIKHYLPPKNFEKALFSELIAEIDKLIETKEWKLENYSF